MIADDVGTAGPYRVPQAAHALPKPSSIARSLRRDRPLSKAHAGYGNPLKETGRDDGAGWILLQLRLFFPQCLLRIIGRIIANYTP
jgi:hypothetical protein